MKRFFPQSAVSLLLLTAILHPSVVTADGHERRQLDSHEHGITTLNIALDGSELVLQLEGPGMNFVGFEHAARTAEQTQAIADTLIVLEDGEQLFSIDGDAECVLAEAMARHITEDETHDDHDGHNEDQNDEHDDEHDDEQHDEHADHTDDTEEAQHSEFTGEYLSRCNQPDELEQVNVRVFERFTLTTEIETSFLGPDVQTFKNLIPADPELRLQR
jgi:hypothetical protein